MTGAIVTHRRMVREGSVVALLLQLAVLLVFTVSGSMLQHYGWAYGDTGGSLLGKFHPSTLILVLVFAVALAERGNPLTALLALLHARPLLVVYLVGILFMTWYSGRVIGLPYTLFIETFLPAFVVLVLLQGTDEAVMRRLALIVHLALLANAALAMFEYVTHYRFTPLVINGEVIDYDVEPRSTALMGHPLANAVMTGSYLLALSYGAGRDLAPMLRPLAFLFGAASLAVFGGRAATALLFVFLAIHATRALGRVARGAPFDARNVLAGVVVLPIVGLFIVGLNEVGFFDVFLDRVRDDAGSTETRIVMFELFRYQNWHDLLFAPDPELVATYARILGTELGIESFVVQYMLSYGIIATLIFLPCLFVFGVEVARSVRAGGAVILTYFFLVALTSNSLSAKSVYFTCLVTMLLVLLRREAPEPGPAAVTTDRALARRTPARRLAGEGAGPPLR